MDSNSSSVDFNWLDNLVGMMEDDPIPEQHPSPSNFITPPPSTPSPPLNQHPTPSTPSFSITPPLNQHPAPSTPPFFITPPLNQQHHNPTPSNGILISRLVDDKLSRALRLYKEYSSGEGTLTQVWVPIMSEAKKFLTTINHLFVLQGNALCGYRQVSRLFSFDAVPRPRSFSDLPGRVFTSKLPEYWTSEVSCYNSDEFLRMYLARDHKVSGSLALPVFEFEDYAHTSCCAVLELVTTHERPDFDAEMDLICKALQAVELSSSRPPRLDLQSLSLLQNAGLGEIKGVLYAVCRANKLPLALTWLHCEVVDVRRHDGGIYKKSILCVDETACYWQDARMEGFVRACTTRPLQQGQGIVGKSLQSDVPLFHPDVKQLHISDYPLVHHARRLGLAAAVAIRITSAYTGPDHDYIMEFFLPVDLKEASEQETMKNSIASTIRRICRSLKKVPADIQLGEGKDFTPAGIIDNDPPEEEAAAGKRRIADDEGITLRQLEPYFSGSMTHAAKCLGVAPITIMRACLKYGITRWPSRKIQNVVPGGLVLDPAASGAGSSIQQDTFCFDKPQQSERQPMAPKRQRGESKAPQVELGSTSMESPSGGDDWIKYLMLED